MTDEAKEARDRKPTLTVVTSNEFDPDALRINQDFVKKAGVTKLITTVPMRKPTSGQMWFRTHPDDEYRLAVALIELKDERELYIVSPVIVRELPLTMFYIATLQLSISRQGNVFLWPLRHASNDGKDNTAWISARDAAVRARTRWTQIGWNPQNRAYDIEHAPANIPEPEWPDPQKYPMAKFLEIAAKDRLIKSVDHPVLQSLTGTV